MNWSAWLPVFTLVALTGLAVAVLTWQHRESARQRPRHHSASPQAHDQAWFDVQLPESGSPSRYQGPEDDPDFIDELKNRLLGGPSPEPGE